MREPDAFDERMAKTVHFTEERRVYLGKKAVKISGRVNNYVYSAPPEAVFTAGAHNTFEARIKTVLAVAVKKGASFCPARY